MTKEQSVDGGTSRLRSVKTLKDVEGGDFPKGTEQPPNGFRKVLLGGVRGAVL